MKHVRPPRSNHNDFGPTASWKNLRLRAQLLKRVREFFDPRDYLEVTTPLLSADSVVDRHLDPLQVTLFDDPRSPHRGRVMFLQTSPEFHMKRLLAGGAHAIYQVTHAVRGGETGRLHNPEFTIVEWYRRGDTMQDGMATLDEFCNSILERGCAERLSYGDAFRQYAGIDPHTAEPQELAELCQSLGILEIETDLRVDRDHLLNLLLVDRVEPHLGRGRPTILYNYPATQPGLARIRPDDPLVAERFELYVDSIELANGYHELLDPAELRVRTRNVNQQRREDGKPTLPGESRLLDAMDHGLPACTGVAAGFDRMVMVRAGAHSLADVIPFPIDRA